MASPVATERRRSAGRGQMHAPAFVADAPAGLWFGHPEGTSGRRRHLARAVKFNTLALCGMRCDLAGMSNVRPGDSRVCSRCRVLAAVR
jgi:hypothetical protein